APSAVPTPPPAPLRRLLDGLEAAHKSDVREFTVGHLNESRLYKPPEPPRRNRLLERADGAGSPNGAVGSTDTSVPVRRVRLLAPKQHQQQQPKAPQQPELHREALIEEILPPTAPPQRFLAPVETGSDGSHAANYRRAQLVRKRLVREQDTTEQDLMSGYGAVRDLELRLQENLRIHFGNSTGPSFHRLQLYSAALEEIIRQSNTFGSVLHRIKCAYDDYLAWLLDGTSPAQHRHLRAQLDQLCDPAAESELGRLQDRLAQLESDAELALAGLSDSRQRLAEAEAADLVEAERDRLAEEQLELAAEEQRLRSGGGGGSQEETSADRCERLLREIWAGLDSLAELRHDLRANQSPLVCAAHLERCCRQAHAEMQTVEEELGRLAQANQAGVDRLAAAMAPATVDGDSAAQLAACEDVDDSDLSRAMRLLSYDCAAAALASETLDLPDDLMSEGDSRKWDWYIS
ncbi:hypothetical protein BOX15_Mlig028973g2, partial [Macrostomum lignano]